MSERKEPTLGTLENVDLREAWPNEALDFTPWLSRNLDLLGRELDIKLECEDTEVDVSGLRADIVARVPEDGGRVIIENQLDEANLAHLGQLLAYVAGLEATAMVWIAPSFRDYHLAAIRWLNEHTENGFAFFAVTIQLLRVGDSLPAPRFETVERPNEWTRATHRSVAHNAYRQFCEEFWRFCHSRWPPLDIKLHAGHNLEHLVRDLDLKIVQYLGYEAVGVFFRSRGREEKEDFGLN